MPPAKSVPVKIVRKSATPAIAEPSTHDRSLVSKASDKKLKSYRLSEKKIAAVREVLGAPNATAAIEAALDLVIFRHELISGTDALFGLEVAPYDLHGN